MRGVKGESGSCNRDDLSRENLAVTIDFPEDLSRESLAVSVALLDHLSRERLTVKGLTAKCLPTDLQMRYFECLFHFPVALRRRKRRKLWLALGDLRHSP